MKFMFFGRREPTDPERYWYRSPDGRYMVSSQLCPAEMEAHAKKWADEAPAREAAAIAARRAENQRRAEERAAWLAERAEQQATAERESQARVDAWHAANPGWSRAGDVDGRRAFECPESVSDYPYRDKYQRYYGTNDERRRCVDRYHNPEYGERMWRNFIEIMNGRAP
jgi:hypothetical protein